VIVMRHNSLQLTSHAHKHYHTRQIYAISACLGFVMFHLNKIYFCTKYAISSINNLMKLPHNKEKSRIQSMMMIFQVRKHGIQKMIRCESASVGGKRNGEPNK
jgi:hypothetical protein